MSAGVKVAAVQMAMSESMEDNYRKSLRFLREGAEQGACLICFPEGQLGRYVPQYPSLQAEDFAVGLSHPYVRGLCAACREMGVFGAFSVCLKERDAVYAAGLLVSDAGELMAIERKKHIVRARHFYEQDYFTPGGVGFSPVDTPFGRIGQIMCFDRHYPESFRSLALQDCALAIVPVANDKSEPAELFQWEMRVPAFQNGMYVLMVNRVGREGAMDFSGGSMLCGPAGELLAEAGENEGLLVAELDTARCAEQREQTQYLRLRRREVFEI